MLVVIFLLLQHLTDKIYIFIYIYYIVYNFVKREVAEQVEDEEEEKIEPVAGPSHYKKRTLRFQMTQAKSKKQKKDEVDDLADDWSIIVLKPK
jgi:hypothetical protein